MKIQCAIEIADNLSPEQQRETVSFLTRCVEARLAREVEEHRKETRLEAEARERWEEMRTAKEWLEAGRVPYINATWRGRNGVAHTDTAWADPLYGHLSPGGWLGAECPWRCAVEDTIEDPEQAREILAAQIREEPKP